MTKRSRRQLKKLHRYWLDSDIIDLSQNRYWRKRLFASTPGQILSICIGDTQGLCKAAVAAISRYKLHFSVQRVEADEADSWLSADDAVIFKFWATDYPVLKRYTGNNPDLV